MSRADDMHGVIPGASDEEPAVRSQRHIVGPYPDGDIAQAMLHFEIDHGDIATAPVAYVEITAIGAQHAGVRVLARGDRLSELQRIGLKNPDFVIGFVAYIQRAGRRLQSKARQKDRILIGCRVNAAFQCGFAICVLENMDHTTVSAADIEPFAISAKDHTVKDLFQWNKLALVSWIKTDNVYTFLVVTRTNGNHRFPIRRNDHFQRHITDANVLASGRKAKPVEEQISVGNQVLPDPDGGAIDVFGGEPRCGLSEDGRADEAVPEKEDSETAEYDFHLFICH